MTITLPDPKDGTPVELEIDPACPYFKWNDEDGEWDFQQPVVAISPLDAVVHCIGLGGKVYEVREYERWLPIIAAVAVCWFEVRAQQIKMTSYTHDERLEKLSKRRKLNAAAFAWRKFTARPEGM